MIVAIMQPYFFPYIGYFQLMEAVDCFVFYDDAQFMKGGWVNRNRILRDGAPAWWTFPIVRDDYTLPIRERRYFRTREQDAAMLAKLEGAYRGAPRYWETRAVLASCFEDATDSVSIFNQGHLQALSRRMDIQCEFVRSSEVDGDRSLRGQERVIDLCKRLGATQYINASGGVDLYDADAFAEAGIELGFIRSLPTSYAQLGAPHVPFLSIVDVLMFNDEARIRQLLGHFERMTPQ